MRICIFLNNLAFGEPCLLNVLRDLNDRIEELPRMDNGALELFLRRARLIIRKAFGEESHYLEEISEVCFNPEIDPFSDQFQNEGWVDVLSKLHDILIKMIEDFQLSISNQSLDKNKNGFL